MKFGTGAYGSTLYKTPLLMTVPCTSCANLKFQKKGTIFYGFELNKNSHKLMRFGTVEYGCTSW